jgi:hypothetical protein
MPNSVSEEQNALTPSDPLGCPKCEIITVIIQYIHFRGTEIWLERRLYRNIRYIAVTLNGTDIGSVIYIGQKKHCRSQWPRGLGNGS